MIIRKSSKVDIWAGDNIISDDKLVTNKRLKGKQAEQENITKIVLLQDTLNDLKKIIDSSPDVICSLNAEGHFVNVSFASERIWGYNLDELRGKKYFDLVLLEDMKNSINTFTKVMKGLSVTIFENRYRHKNGSIVPLLWSATWNDTDKLMYCIAKDATEKKRVEKALEIQRLQFYDLFLHAPFSMGVLKEPNHIFEMCNPLYLQLIGKKDIIGKSVKEVLPEIAKQGFIELLNDVYETGNRFSANEMRIQLDKDHNGNLVDKYLNFIYEPEKDSKGIVQGIFFFAIDVSEQVRLRKKIEQSEKQYRQIVETAQEGIWMIDENSKTIFVNKKMSEILGYTQKEMIGKNTLFFKDKKEHKKVLQYLERRKYGVNETYDATFITKDGSHIWTNVSTNPIFDEQGLYKGALAMITDITKRKNQEIQITKNSTERELLIAELTKSIKDLKQFTFITSHNFKAPLSNLVGLLSLLDYSTLSRANKDIIEMFKISTIQLDTTINDLINILINLSSI